MIFFIFMRNYYLFLTHNNIKIFMRNFKDKHLYYYILVCLLSMLSAFFPSSNVKPNVSTKKNINIIIKPNIPLI